MSTRETKYRIDQVTIEGFRGFTKPQTVDIGGRNVFIFGENGRGKSSIIEAIRWCLFGAPAGGDIEVRNTFYDLGECRVSLTLAGPDGPLQFLRELRPGAQRSRQTIRTPSGATLLERDALPGLARIGHQEGAQVIFSAQQASGRGLNVERPDFTRVLCCYLRLDEVPSLLTRLAELLEERNEESTELAAHIEEVEKEHRQRLREIRAKLEELVGNPPWGDGPAPTKGQTDEKLFAFARRVAAISEQEVSGGLTAENALAKSRRWLDESIERTAESLQNQVQDLSGKTEVVSTTLPELREAVATVCAARQSCDDIRRRVTQLLGGDDYTVLKDRLTALEEARDQSARCFEVVRLAAELCDTHALLSCPACGANYDDSAALLDRLHRQRDANHPDRDASLIEELRTRVEEVEILRGRLSETEGELAGAQQKVHDFKARLCELLGVVEDGGDMTGIEHAATRLFETLESLKCQLDDAESEKKRWNDQAKELERELRYHQLRDAAEDLEWWLKSGLKEAREQLAAYRDLLATTTEIRTAVRDCFHEAIDRATPSLNEMLTEVYARLTRQASYDKVVVDRDPTEDGKLDLRVASTRRPGHTYKTNVLNGQAARALQLVPYFVFSRFLPDLMELDLLLIDDPSESFDTSHVRSLVQELAEAATHAQLIVATHEGDKFEPFLSSDFPADSLGRIDVEDFTLEEGPVLAKR